MREIATGLATMKKRGLKIYLGLGLFGIVVLGAIAAAAYYQEEVTAFFQGGWNRGAITRVATDFIARVQGRDYEGALGLTQPDRFKPVREGGRLVGLEKNDPSGHSYEKWEFARMFPAGNPRVASIQWSTADGGAYLVNLTFPDGVETRFLIQRVNGASRIIAYLGSTL